MNTLEQLVSREGSREGGSTDGLQCQLSVLVQSGGKINA